MSNRARIRIALLLPTTLLAFMSWGCGTLASSSPSAGSPGQSIVVAAGEKETVFGRTYRLHVPRSYQPDSGDRLPLVVALHGGVASARILEQQTGFSELGDEEGFFVVYPNGIGIFGLLRHWNGGWCCARAANKQVDDVGFVRRVIEQVAAAWPIDERRIYLVGYSNGGMLAHWTARKHPEQFAGLGIYAAPETDPGYGGEPESASSLPTIIVHASGDQRLPVEGQDISSSASRGVRGRILGAVETGQRWAVRNGCQREPEIEQGPGVKRTTFCGDSSSPVEVLVLDGWSHEWPGPRGTGRLDAGEALSSFDAAATMWQFFSRR